MPRIVLAVAFLFSPSLPCFAAVLEGEWHSLFDGRTLEGWEANESPSSWKIEDGTIVTSGPRSHLFYTGPIANHAFKNFEFSAEVKTTPGSNSGIYFHTRFAPEPWPQAGYEAQVINTSFANPSGYTELKMTGSIYAVRNTWHAPAVDGVWFEYRIKVSGRTIQTFINGALVCQYTEPARAWRAPDKPGRYLSAGTFALQAHDPESVVRYRDLKVRLLPDDAPSLEPPLADAELDALITQFSDQNIALIDCGLMADSAARELVQAEDARRFGVTPSYLFPEHTTELSRLSGRAAVLLIQDRESPPSVPLLKAAKANGAKLAFSSGGDTRLDPERLKRRLLAMQEANVGWRDIWVPGR